MMRKLIAVLFIFIISSPFSSNAKDWVYVVADGDNIWNISKRYLVDINKFKQVQSLNNIPVAQQLQPGTVLRIPLVWLKKHAAHVNVKSLSGSSEIVSEGIKSEVTLTTQFTLGDELRVAKGATITLLFADQTEITLSDDVLITFDHLSQYGKTGMVDTRLRVQSGKVEVRAQKQNGAGARLDIETASAITSVRGTIFRVGVDTTQTDNSLIEVLEGRVAVANETNAVDVKQGFGIKVEKGKALQQPVKLLPAPKILKLPATVSQQNQIVSWQAVKLAHRYKIQIATDGNFSAITWQQSQESNAITLPNLPDGDYFIRISAVAKNGLEGLTKPVAFTINLYPSAPTLTAIDSIFISAAEPLIWSEVEGIDYFNVQIAKDKKFSQLVVDKQVNKELFLIANPLKLGQYYWRVASLQGKDLTDRGPFSPVSGFSYTTKIKAPELRISSRLNNIEVIWPPLPDDQHIVVQTSDSSEFTNTTTPTLLSRKSYLFELTDQKAIYIRAKVILTEHDIASQWSQYCKVAGKFELCKK